MEGKSQPYRVEVPNLDSDDSVSKVSSESSLDEDEPQLQDEATLREQYSPADDKIAHLTSLLNVLNCDSSVEGLVSQVKDCVAIINVVADNADIKRKYVRILKNSAYEILQCVKELQSRLTTEETTRLQAEKNHLCSELVKLRKEVKELRARTSVAHGLCPSKK